MGHSRAVVQKGKKLEETRVLYKEQGGGIIPCLQSVTRVSRGAHGRRTRDDSDDGIDGAGGVEWNCQETVAVLEFGKGNLTEIFLHSER